MIDATAISNTPLCFRKNLLGKNEELIMSINDKIRDEKIQHNTNREAAKISAFSLGKTDIYEYPTGKEILPSNQNQVVEQTKNTDFCLRKAFEKQIKTIKDAAEKQLNYLQTLNTDHQLKAIGHLFSCKRKKASWRNANGF